MRSRSRLNPALAQIQDIGPDAAGDALIAQDRGRGRRDGAASASEDRSPITADRPTPPSRTRTVHSSPQDGLMWCTLALFTQARVMRPLRVLQDDLLIEAHQTAQPEHRWHPIEGAQRVDLSNR